MVTPQLSEGQHASFCILYNVVAENQEGSISSSRSKYFSWYRYDIKTVPIPLNFILFFCIFIIILCHVNEKYLATVCLLKLLYSRNKRVLRVLLYRSNMHFIYVFSMVRKVKISGIWTTFESYIIPYNKQGMPGLFLRYGVPIHPGVHDPSLPITYLVCISL